MCIYIKNIMLIDMDNFLLNIMLKGKINWRIFTSYESHLKIKHQFKSTTK